MLEHGKVYKWDDISNEYPNMYAVSIIDNLVYDIILPTPYLMQNYGT